MRNESLPPDEGGGEDAASLRVAVVQAAPAGFDLPASLDRARRLLDEAARRGARLAVLPEAFLSGYPKGHDFGTRIGTRSDEGREWYRRAHRSAVEVPGPEVEELSRRCRDLGLCAVVGVIERSGGSLYCSALFLDADRGLVALHRKLVPTGLERLIWAAGDGSGIVVPSMAVGRVGAAICWENYLPLYRSALYAQGVQLYCAPTVDDRDSWIPTMQHVAVEGRCFVLSACQFLTRADLPDPGVPDPDPEEVLIRGGSCIVDPYGHLLAGPLYGEEGLLLADLDLRETVRSRLDLDPAGHSARPDLFRLEVDFSARRSVAPAAVEGSAGEAAPPPPGAEA